MSTLEDNYFYIKKEILKSTCSTHPICFIVVSKKQPIGYIEELFHLGQRDFGENYVQELCYKADQLKSRGFHGIRWHMIGHLQTNKVKKVLPYLSCLHTLDSEQLALTIQKQMNLQQPFATLPVFIQVNFNQESTRSGVAPQNVPVIAQKIASLTALKLQGLMTLPPINEDPRLNFRELYHLEKTLPNSQRKLSMGMSKDFKIALEEGATTLRIGTALFKR